MLSLFASYSQLMRSKNNALIFVFTIFAPLTIFARRYDSDEDNIFLRTDEHSFQREVQGLRGRFMKKNIEKQKVRLLEQLTNNTIFVDGIPHIDIEKSGSRKKEIMAMENGFRSLLGMNGVEYSYKRGYQWRTWRQIEHKGNKTIVCYKCNSVVKTTCKNCSGYWIIEEAPPPCPFEIMSIPNDRELCVIKYANYTDMKSVCSTLFNINNLLIACDNPIETDWKVISKYNKNSKSTLNVICGGQESCQVLTLYTILPDSILFRMINATNHVIYSRVMKRGSKNYACVQNCGVFDRTTKTVVKNEKPLIVNLLRSLPLKNKREFNAATVKTPFVTDFKISLTYLKMLHYSSKNTDYIRSHSRNVRTTQMQNYQPITSLESENLTTVHIPRLAARTSKPIQSFSNEVHKNFIQEISSEEKYKSINIGDSISSRIEKVTKTVCKKLEDKYKERDYSETVED